VAVAVTVVTVVVVMWPVWERFRCRREKFSEVKKRGSLAGCSALYPEDGNLQPKGGVVDAGCQALQGLRGGRIDQSWWVGLSILHFIATTLTLKQ